MFLNSQPHQFIQQMRDWACILHRVSISLSWLLYCTHAQYEEKKKPSLKSSSFDILTSLTRASVLILLNILWCAQHFTNESYCLISNIRVVCLMNDSVSLCIYFLEWSLVVKMFSSADCNCIQSSFTQTLTSTALNIALHTCVRQVSAVIFYTFTLFWCEQYSDYS